MQEELISNWKRDSQTTDTFVRENLSGLSVEQLNWRPDQDTWSIGQQIQHLVLSNEEYADIIGGWAKSPSVQLKPYRPGFWGKMLLMAVGPDSKLPVPVPGPLEPGDGPFDGTVVERYLVLQDHFEAALIAASIHDLNAPLRSPLMPVMRLKMGDALAMTVIHNQRHVRKALRLLGDPAFPR